MSYIGNNPTQPVVQQTHQVLDVLTPFNGVTTTFPLTVGGIPQAPNNAANVIISVNGVLQAPGDAYNISGTNIVFTSAPATGSSFQGVVLGQTYKTVAPPEGQVGQTELQFSSVTTEKLADSAVTADKIASNAIKTINGTTLLGSGDITINTQTITVSGPTTQFVNQTLEFVITNYDSSSTYTITGNTLGVATITGSTVQFVNGAVQGTGSFTLQSNGVSKTVSFVIQPAGVLKPTITSPTNGATGLFGNPTVTSSAFTTAGASDTHATSTWEFWSGPNRTGTLIHTQGAVAQLTSYTIPNGILAVSTAYHVVVRHTGTTLGNQVFSDSIQFTTAAVFGGLIGTAGTMGFGVGIYTSTPPAGFSEMTGTKDTASANYGNYTYTDGQVMCFIPKFYYRIGSASSPRFATYGANAIDVVGIDTFSTTAAANAAGYALHRAFIDGGAEKSGFFLDKYKCSNGTTSNLGTLSGAVRSQSGGVPISLTTSASYTRSQGFVTTEGTCTGILADAVLLARHRGIGIFNVPTIFMYSAVWILQLTHGQSATGAAACAWYDATLTTNFPKGCNNNALSDTNDATVVYASAGDSGTSAKPKTGATVNFNKTTHNGQANGVADLNGGLWEVMLGLTNSGSSATAAPQVATNNFFILKQQVSYLQLKGGWNTANDAWQSAANITTNYEQFTQTATFQTAVAVYWGNQTNAAFSGASSGSGWLNTGAGMPLSDLSTNATGTNLFGQDYLYKYNGDNMTPLAAGAWSGGSCAGLGSRLFDSFRSLGYGTSGFRASSVGV